ncbi:MAG: ABC transporter permease [Phenylobacterium sp.]
MTPLSFRFASRELRGGVRGFRIFLACLALGVAAIAAAGSTAEAFRRGLASQASEILGGDLALTVRSRGFNAADQAALEKAGRVSYAVSSIAMAQSPSGDRRLIELRGVNEAYPLAGQVTLAGAPSLQAAIKPVNGVAGALVEQSLLDRLHMKVGDRFLAGNLPLDVRGVLMQEPDRLARGFALGPRVITNIAAMHEGGFMAPGLPFGETARVALPPGAPLELNKTALQKALGPAVRIRDREDAAPGIHRLIDQLEYFLGFIGLASLVAGGLGVYGAVNAYLENRKPVIATLKALGAEGQLVRDIYLIQIGFLAALGVAIGLAIGAAAPLILGELAKNKLPVPALFAVYPWPLLKAAGFGLLSAAAFSLAPLGRARSTPPASLFRSDLSGSLKIGPEIVGAVLAAVGLGAMAVVTAPTPLAASIMIAGVAVSFGLLWALGWGAAIAAGKARAGARGPLRIGLANLAGPHSAARTASPAIGLGVALLAAVVLIQSALLNQVSEVAPRTAPALVFTDVPGDNTAAFDAAVAHAFGTPLTPKNYLREPFISGRITKVRGLPVDISKIPKMDRWAYDSDVSMSPIIAPPEDKTVIEGRWWPANYTGPPLLVMDVDIAKGEQIKVGDEVTLSVLGTDIDAKVAALRKVDFGGFGVSFPIVINASAMEGANLRQVAIAKASKEQETTVIRELGKRFPTVNVISVREQLEAATDLFDRLALAVRGAAAVAALAGLFVLAGAIAARARARTREAAILKVLGASRAQILGAYVLEYGAVGVIAGAAGVALGYAAAWPVVVRVFHAKWSMDWAGVAALLGAAALVAGIGGLLAAFQALSKRPAPALRAE